GVLKAAVISLQAGGVNSEIILGGPVYADLAANFVSSGQGRISNGLNNTVYSPLLNLNSANGDITVRSASSIINLTSSANVSIANSNSDLILNPTSPNLASLTLSNDRAITITAAIDTSSAAQAGNIIVLAGGNLSSNNLSANGLNGGKIILTSGGALNSGNISSTGLNSGGALILTAGSSLTAAGLNAGATNQGGNILVTGANSVNIGNLSSEGNNGGEITLLSFGNLQLGTVSNNSLINAAPINISAGTSIIAGDIKADGINHAGNITVNAGLSVSLANISASGNSAGKVTINGSGTVTSGNISANGNQGYISVSTAGDTTLGDLSAAAIFGNQNAGRIFVGTFSNLSLSKINASAAGTGNGGLAVLSAAGSLNAQCADLTAVNGNGGLILLSANGIVVSGNNGNGSSIDVSSNSADAGAILVSNSSSNDFIIGAGVGTNRISGNLLANGGMNGGLVGIVSAPHTRLLAATEIRADGQSGKGGQVTLVSNGNFMRSTIDGLISARNNADDSGAISFITPLCTALLLEGSGTVHAGNVVDVGNLIANPITVSVALIGNKVLATPCPDCFPKPPNPQPTEQKLSSKTFSFDLSSIAAALRGAGLGLTERVPTDTLNRSFGPSEKSKNSEEKPGANAPVLTGGLLLQGEIDIAESIISRALANGVLLEQGSLISNLAPANSRDDKLNSFTFQKGIVILAPINELKIQIGELDLRIAAGSIVLLNGDGDSTSILNLYDKHNAAVFLDAENEKLILPPGHQFVLVHKEKSVQSPAKIAYRNQQKTVIKNNLVYSSEFSLASAFSNISLLRSLLSGGARNRDLSHRILKTAAAMSFVKAQKPFKN
ncbi:MAG: hypothetical protein K2X27_22080, partial [Candidatus Obscuribacterales bacterium]|nr:hypothetical protein [Candidatus Obscuribacterales bacterium]